MAREMKNSGIEWIGEIPENWETSLVKHSVRWKSVKGQPESIVLSLYRDYGIVPKNSRDDNHNVTSLDTSTYKVVSIGDFVINKMKAWQGSMAISDYEGIISPAYHICEIINPNLYKKYFHHLMRNHSYLPEYTRLSTGMRIGQWDLGFDDFRNIPFIIPPVDEQKRIVSFIDKKCTEIDAVIEKTKATIEEYKKLKQSVITEAVTKGIRGNRPMKDSGIEWIGEIPVGWECIKNKYLFQKGDGTLKIGPFGSALSGKTLAEGPYKIYNQAHLVSNDFSLSRHFVSEVTFEDLKSYEVRPGDILFSMMGTIGKCRVMPTGYCKGIMDSHLLKARLNNLVDTEFFAYVYDKDNSSIGIRQLNYYSNGSIMSGLNSTIVKNIYIPLPPINEQKEIADYLDQKCAEIDTLIAKKTTLLTELETYKKSLIYEYVTGKKEVREDTASTQVAVYSPYFPVIIKVNNLYNALKAFMFGILDKCNYDTGRVKLEKMMFVAQHSIGFDLGNEYSRAELGPLDSLFYQCEYDLVKDGCIIKNKKRNIRRIYYKPGRNNHKYKEEYNRYFADCDTEIDRIINIFKDYDVQKSERIATLFGAWNDAIIDKRQFTDEDIVEDVLNNWHEHKGDYSKEEWLEDLEEMKKINLIPKGYGKKTVIKND